MSTRELSIQELLVNSMDYQMSNIYTSIPGVVISVHDSLSGMRVDVQPAINMRNEEGTESVPRPSIINVPLQMPITSNGGLTFPIQKGDPVWLMFSMRGLDVWKKGNGLPETPSDMRMFDVRDCCAFPGTYPVPLSPNNPGKRTLPHDTNDVVLVHNIGTGSEVEVRLKQNGDVEINSPNKVTVNCKNAEVNASEKIEMNSQDVEISCENYSVDTVNYSVIATGDNVSQGSFRFDGSIELNGIYLESHRHVETGGITEGPQN